MNKRRHAPLPTVLLATAACLLLLVPTACERDDSGKPGPVGPTKSTATGKAVQGVVPTVYTTFYPTAYFAQRIGGDYVKVVNPCPPDADPATWMPDDPTIAGYQQADLIFINGAGFEEWVQKVSLPESKVVDTTRAFADNFIVFEKTVTHSHGPGGEHTHTGVDGHTWVEPGNAAMQAMAIRDALEREFPAHKDAYRKGYLALETDLKALNKRLQALTPKLGRQVLFASHPAYNYLARAQQWPVDSFHYEPTMLLDDDEIEHLKLAAEEQGAKIMLWEGEPLDELAQKIEAIGLTNVVFSPGESLDPEQAEAGEDYLTIMNANIDRLAEALDAVQGS